MKQGGREKIHITHVTCIFKKKFSCENIIGITTYESTSTAFVQPLFSKSGIKSYEITIFSKSKLPKFVFFHKYPVYKLWSLKIMNGQGNGKICLNPIPRFYYFKVLFDNTFYHKWGKETCLLYLGLHCVEVRYIEVSPYSFHREISGINPHPPPNFLSGT